MREAPPMLSSIGMPAGPAALSPRLQHVLCILLAAAAVKEPLGIPLYLNGLLLVVGLFTIIVVQRLEAVLLWPLGLVGVGLLWAAAIGTLPTSGPRLVQVGLIVFAAGLMARLDPALFGRYLALLLPLILLVLMVEPLLPTPVYGPRILFGLEIPRQSGLHGEHNYTAMLYGVIGLILAQHPPRILGLLPLVVALSAVSRGFLGAMLAWLGAKAVGRQLTWIAPLAVLLLCAQPVIVLGIDTLIDDATRVELRHLTTSRFPIWTAYAKMGLSTPLGVGYWEGPANMGRFDTFFGPGYPPRPAHSLYLQIFGEFGWFGYLLFVGFLLHLVWLVRRRAAAQLPILLFVLVGYTFYSGLSDWAFWIVIGYVLACARVAASPTEPTDDGAESDAAAAGAR
jgi:hypothetical protein